MSDLAPIVGLWGTMVPVDPNHIRFGRPDEAIERELAAYAALAGKYRILQISLRYYRSYLDAEVPTLLHLRDLLLAFVLGRLVRSAQYYDMEGTKHTPHAQRYWLTHSVESFPPKTDIGFSGPLGSLAYGLDGVYEASPFELVEAALDALWGQDRLQPDVRLRRLLQSLGVPDVDWEACELVLQRLLSDPLESLERFDTLAGELRAEGFEAKDFRCLRHRVALDALDERQWALLDWLNRQDGIASLGWPVQPEDRFAAIAAAQLQLAPPAGMALVVEAVALQALQPVIEYLSGLPDELALLPVTFGLGRLEQPTLRLLAHAFLTAADAYTALGLFDTFVEADDLAERFTQAARAFLYYLQEDAPLEGPHRLRVFAEPPCGIPSNAGLRFLTPLPAPEVSGDSVYDLPDPAPVADRPVFTVTPARVYVGDVFELWAYFPDRPASVRFGLERSEKSVLLSPPLAPYTVSGRGVYSLKVRVLPGSEASAWLLLYVESNGRKLYQPLYISGLLQTEYPLPPIGWVPPDELQPDSGQTPGGAPSSGGPGSGQPPGGAPSSGGSNPSQPPGSGPSFGGPGSGQPPGSGPSSGGPRSGQPPGNGSPQNPQSPSGSPIPTPIRPGSRPQTFPRYVFFCEDQRRLVCSHDPDHPLACIPIRPGCGEGQTKVCLVDPTHPLDEQGRCQVDPNHPVGCIPVHEGCPEGYTAVCTVDPTHSLVCLTRPGEVPTDSTPTARPTLPTAPCGPNPCTPLDGIPNPTFNPNEACAPFPNTDPGGSGCGGHGLYRSMGMSTPDCISVSGETPWIHRQASQGQGENDLRRIQGDWVDQKYYVHSHRSPYLSEVKAHYIVAPPRIQAAIDAYKPQLDFMGALTGEGVLTFLPALDMAHGHNMQRISTSQQINAQFWKATTGSYFDVNSPMTNFVAQNFTVNSKGMHLLSDIYQANHIHTVIRAQDWMGLMGHATQRYNVEELYETSANAQYVAGDHQIYSDFLWVQVGQHYPNARSNKEDKPRPARGNNECRLHPYRTQLTGPWGSCWTSIANDWLLQCHEGKWHVDSAQEAILYTRFKPIYLYASKDCGSEETFRCNPNKPNGCSGDVYIGAKDGIYLHARQQDITLWAQDKEIRQRSGKDYGVYSEKSVHITADKNIELGAEEDFLLSADNWRLRVKGQSHQHTLKQAFHTALEHHLRAEELFAIDGRPVLINCNASRRATASRVYNPKEGVPVKAPKLSLKTRVYRQMTDPKPLNEEGMAGPRPQNQPRPQSPEPNYIYADHPDAGKHTHWVGGSPDMRDETFHD